MAETEPRFVHAVLDWPPTWFLARLLLVGGFILAALVAEHARRHGRP